jgi:hypothetical protein
MSNLPAGNEYKEKFRPEADAALEKEVEAALADVAIEQLYAFDKPRPAAPAEQQADPMGDGTRRGRVVELTEQDRGDLAEFHRLENEPEVEYEQARRQLGLK